MKSGLTGSVRSLVVVGIMALLISACGNGRSGGGGSGIGPLGSETPVTVSGVTPARGIFDPSLTENGGTLWMSYSVVNVSSNDPALPNINTRIASSTNGGRTWIDSGVAPNLAQDVVIVPGFPALDYWASWQFEVSRLVYDPHDIVARRWKLLWHRYLAANQTGTVERRFQHSWIGYTTADSVAGLGGSERKLFVGSLYDAVTNGAAEYNLATLYPAQLGGCQAFTEPGMLVTAALPSGSNVYISLKCAGSSGKVVLLKCTGDFTAGNCTYRGDLLLDSEAQQFASTGQSYDGFSATELVAASGRNFLIVTPTTNDEYRGCLVFEISNLDSATLVGRPGNPTLLKRIGASTSAGFHGACGYTPGATVTGIIYGKYSATATPPFRLFDTDVQLP